MALPLSAASSYRLCWKVERPSSATMKRRRERSCLHEKSPGTRTTRHPYFTSGFLVVRSRGIESNRVKDTAYGSGLPSAERRWQRHAGEGAWNGSSTSCFLNFFWWEVQNEIRTPFFDKKLRIESSWSLRNLSDPFGFIYFDRSPNLEHLFILIIEFVN